MLLQLPVFHSFLWLILHCVCLFIEALLWGNILGCRPPMSPVLPPEAPGEGPSCFFQHLGVPGGSGLVAAFLLSLPPSSWGFSSVSVSPPVSTKRTQSLDGGPPHPGGPPLQSFPWLLLCVFSVVRILVTRLRPLLIHEDLVPGTQLLNHSKFLIHLSRASLVFPKTTKLTCLC